MILLTARERARWALLGDPNLLTVPQPLESLLGRVERAILEFHLVAMKAHDEKFHDVTDKEKEVKKNGS